MDFIELIPDGVAVTSVIVTIILFLRYLKEQATNLSKITDDCHQKSHDMMKQFQSALGLILQAQEKRDAIFMEKMSSLEKAIHRLAEKLDGIQKR